MGIKTWNSRRVSNKALDESEQRITKACYVCLNHSKRLINRGQPRKTTKGGYIVGLDHSVEGEPPKKITGALINAGQVVVKKTFNQIKGKFGFNIEYARRLELGFVGRDSRGKLINQGERPFIRRALAEKKKKVKQIIGVK